MFVERCAKWLFFDHMRLGYSVVGSVDCMHMSTHPLRVLICNLVQWQQPFHIHTRTWPAGFAKSHKNRGMGVTKCLRLVQYLCSLLFNFLSTFVLLWCKGKMVCWDRVLHKVSKQLLAGEMPSLHDSMVQY